MRYKRSGVAYCTKCGKTVFLGESIIKKVFWKTHPICSWCSMGIPPIGPFLK